MERGKISKKTRNFRKKHHFEKTRNFEKKLPIIPIPKPVYFEVTCKDEGLSRVGWSTKDAQFNLGTCRNGYGYGGTAKKSNNRNFDDYGEPYGLHDKIGCCIDFDSRTIEYFKNGKSLGVAFDRLDIKQVYYPAIVLKNAEVEVNFDESKQHKYPGFSSLKSCKSLISGKGMDSKGGAQDLSHLSNLPSAIIIEPSRELAMQTAHNVEMFSKYKVVFLKCRILR